MDVLVDDISSGVALIELGSGFVVIKVTSRCSETKEITCAKFLKKVKSFKTGINYIFDSRY